MWRGFMREVMAIADLGDRRALGLGLAEQTLVRYAMELGWL